MVLLILKGLKSKLLFFSEMFLNKAAFTLSMKHILKCSKCGEYTMDDVCKCGGKALTSKPPKYSPEDKYGKYRRQVKKEQLIKEGLL